MWPSRRRSILTSSASMHSTSWPLSARQAPVTRPTYPVPTTLTFITRLLLDCETTSRAPYWLRNVRPHGLSGKIGIHDLGVQMSDSVADSRHILVTGAAGFIGMHACAALLERGWRVHGVDNLNAYYAVSLKEDRLANLRRHPAASHFRFTRLDVADAEAISTLFTRERFS